MNCLENSSNKTCENIVDKYWKIAKILWYKISKAEDEKILYGLILQYYHLQDEYNKNYKLIICDFIKSLHEIQLKISQDLYEILIKYYCFQNYMEEIDICIKKLLLDRKTELLKNQFDKLGKSFAAQLTYIDMYRNKANKSILSKIFNIDYNPVSEINLRKYVELDNVDENGLDELSLHIKNDRRIIREYRIFLKNRSVYDDDYYWDLLFNLQKNRQNFLNNKKLVNDLSNRNDIEYLKLKHLQAAENLSYLDYDRNILSDLCDWILKDLTKILTACVNKFGKLSKEEAKIKQTNDNFKLLPYWQNSINESINNTFDNVLNQSEFCQTKEDFLQLQSFLQSCLYFGDDSKWKDELENFIEDFIYSIDKLPFEEMKKFEVLFIKQQDLQAHIQKNFPDDEIFIEYFNTSFQDKNFIFANADEDIYLNLFDIADDKQFIICDKGGDKSLFLYFNKLLQAYSNCRTRQNSSLNLQESIEKDICMSVVNQTIFLKFYKQVLENQNKLSFDEQEILLRKNSLSALEYLFYLESLLSLVRDAVLYQFQLRLYQIRPKSLKDIKHLWLEIINKAFPEYKIRKASTDVIFFDLFSQNAIFERPSTFAEKIIGRLAGLAIWSLSMEQEQQTLEKYKNLMQISNKSLFLENLSYLDLPSPLDENFHKRLAYQLSFALVL